MRTITIQLFTATELQVTHPTAFVKAHQHFNRQEDTIPNEHTIYESLNALIIQTRGVEITSSHLSPFARSFLNVEFTNPDAENLRSARAFAWLENHLLNDLRIQWSAQQRLTKAKLNKPYRSVFPTESKARLAYFPGAVPPFPLTGVCFDQNYLQALTASLRQGKCLKDAFEDLAQVYQTLVDAEYQYSLTEEFFIETADTHGWEFEASGKWFRAA